MYCARPFNRSLSHSRLLAVILLTSLSGTPWLAHAQDRVLITFNVRDGTTFIETLRFEKSVVQGNSAPSETEWESQGHYTIRRTADGYSVYVKPVKPVDMRVSESSAALGAGLMPYMRLRYDLDARGILRNIAGAEQAAAELENILPTRLRPALGIIGLTPANLRRALAAAWRIRGLFDFAQFSGKTMALGRELQGPDTIYPSAIAGSFRTTGHGRTSGPVTCGNKRCIKLESIGASRDPALGNALAQHTRGMLGGLARTFAPRDKQPTIPQMRITDPHERVSLTRIFDPDTGLHHSYTQEHDVRATIRIDGPGAVAIPLHITVKRHYTYQY